MRSVVEVDCLIIGGGPTGFTLGVGLLRAGKSVVIAEKHISALGFSRAILVSTDSLRFLSEYEVTPRLLKKGVPLDGLSCYVNDDLVSSAQFDANVSNHPIILPQEETESCLKEYFLELGGSLLLGYNFHAKEHDLTEVESKSPLTVLLRSSKPEYALPDTFVRCSWLFGCDGVHSSVRKALDVNYPGTTHPEQQNFVMDVVVESWPFPTMFTVWFQAADVGLLFRITTTSTGTATTAAADVPIIVRVIGTTEKACKFLLQKLSVKQVLWDGTFTSSYRLADSYGRGNVWLAGDAAHVHSPLGGRGMNMGIADAVALASAVAQDQLSGYEAQRRPVARLWVWANYMLSQLAMGQGWQARAVRWLTALAIRGLAFLLGPRFAELAFQSMTASAVKRRKVPA